MKYSTTFFFFFLTAMVFAQEKDLTYYLPDINYNEEIPTPKEFLGYQVGEWHVSHDQLYHYMKALAETSDRVTITEYARSHENRPLVYLTITSLENHSNLDQLKASHRQLTDPANSESVNINDIPIVIYQGYSIHGNEASGSNAALLNAYYLAAGEDPSVEEKLNNAIILLDPSYNPDGLHRFSSWVNMHKSKNLSSDPNDREYNEEWPRGRTNHYWFDLNRDWLLLTHPESQGRIKVFHEWKPDILTDHHEMGTNSTFFFQPGIPSRTNPNTPQKNQVLTEEIAKFHVQALDEIGSLYYTKASFDDFYYGKGSTYPDINGAVGILFEQASSRGHLQESVNGLLSFPFTIRNQVTTSLSTQLAGINLRLEMLEYKRKFYKDAMADASKNRVKAYVVTDPDAAKLDRFLTILHSHDIKIYKAENKLSVDGQEFNAGNSYVIPTDQYQTKLIKTIFEKVTKFQDSIFYDVSAWTLPLAFDLNYAALTSGQLNSIGQGGSFKKGMMKTGSIAGDDQPYAYILTWDDFYAPTVLHDIMEMGLNTKVATKEIIIQSPDGPETFGRGSIIIPVQNQPMSESKITEALGKITMNYPVAITGLKTGYGDNNETLGNPSMLSLEKPKIMVLVGNGASSYDAGEVWHYLDTRLQVPITKMDTENFSSRALSRYNTIIMPSGFYNLDDNNTKAIKSWVGEGGNLILLSRSVDWAVRNKMINLKRKSGPDREYGATYADASANNGARVLGGAIFNTKADLTHPLLYGYQDDQLAVFRRGTTFYEEPKNGYASPLNYSQEPLLSGYVPSGIEEVAAGSSALTVHRSGRGRIVAIMDNPLFRGYWWGGNRLLANAIFFTDIISGSTLAE